MSAKVKNDYQQLRVDLLRKGTNLRRWAAKKSYPLTTVYEAARGLRSGIKAVRIRRELEEFAHE